MSETPLSDEKAQACGDRWGEMSCTLRPGHDGMHVDERVFGRVSTNADYGDSELHEMCALDGDWGGTEWGGVILRLLDDRDAWRGQVVTIRGQQRHALRRAEEAETAVRRVEELADGYGHAGQIDVANAITEALRLPPGEAL